MLGIILGFFLGILGRKGKIKPVQNTFSASFNTKGDENISCHITPIVYLYNSSLVSQFIIRPRMIIPDIGPRHMPLFKEESINIDARKVYHLQAVSTIITRNDNETSNEFFYRINSLSAFFTYVNKKGNSISHKVKPKRKSRIVRVILRTLRRQRYK